MSPSPGRTRMGTSSAQAGPATSQAAPKPAVTEPSAPRVSPETTGRPPSSAPRPAWVRPAVITAALLVAAVVVVLAARWLRSIPQVEDFLASYPGHTPLPEGAPVGIPAWLGWQHFFNMFFMVLIVRTGLEVRLERRPPGYWTPKRDSFFSPKGNTPKKVSLSQWLHQALDVLWVVNGLIYIVLLFATSQWQRIVPTSWDVIPNMLSTGLQYASLDWPTENGWVQYNALQLVTYFLTVFVAAPLAILSGLRMSTWWPANAGRLNRIYPIEAARAVHFPVMVYFVAFTVVHLALVFFTGALRNLNHMYASKDEVDWWGLVIFLVSLAAVAAAWFLTKPLFTRPVAALMGSVSSR